MAGAESIEHKTPNSKVGIVIKHVEGTIELYQAMAERHPDRYPSGYMDAVIAHQRAELEDLRSAPPQTSPL